MIAHYSTFKVTKNPRFCRVNVISKDFDNSDEPTCTDKSHYRPTAPAFSQVSSNVRTGLYDYPDGKPNGIDVSFLRQRGLDELEVQAFIDRLQNLSDEQIKDYYESLNLEEYKKDSKKLKENIQNISDSISKNSNSSSEQSE